MVLGLSAFTPESHISADTEPQRCADIDKGSGLAERSADVG